MTTDRAIHIFIQPFPHFVQNCCKQSIKIPSFLPQIISQSLTFQAQFFHPIQMIRPILFDEQSFDDFPIPGFPISQKYAIPPLLLHLLRQDGSIPLQISNYRPKIQFCLLFIAEITQFILQQYLKKIKDAILMNYCFDIQQIDQNKRNTSDSEPSQHYLLEKAMEKLAKVQKKSKVKMSSFSWSKTEEKKYINFLKVNFKLFSLSPKQRKIIKINVMMSYAIKTRTSAQCHSHHQKMMLKYDNIQSIIESHLHLFDKQSKTQARTQPIIDVESKEIQAPSFEEIILEQDSKVQPLWWRYLDLMDEQQESLWQSSYFFSQ